MPFIAAHRLSEKCKDGKLNDTSRAVIPKTSSATEGWSAIETRSLKKFWLCDLSAKGAVDVDPRRHEDRYDIFRLKASRLGKAWLDIGV
jgi:hypothetical protein